MDVRVERLVLRFREPFTSALGEVRERALLVLRLDEGVGEAAPFQPYDGVTEAGVHDALRAYRPLLEASDGSDRAELLAACRALAPLPQALAAVDIALWDLAARRDGAPLAKLLAPHAAAEVAVNATIGAQDRAGAAAQALVAARAGFRCLKVKAGVGDDAGRLAAVRAVAGPDVAIRIDANGAWTVDEARRALEALAPVGIELCEEPVHGIDELREVAAGSPVPVGADESASDPGALDAGLPFVALKLSRHGGVSGTLAAAQRARAAGSEVYLSSTFDGPVGIAAALHVAAALAPLPACGLATLDLFEPADNFAALLPRDGRIAVPVS